MVKSGSFTKKNGKILFCVDFRKLNAVLGQDDFEIARIRSILCKLHGMKYYTLIDLEDGFFDVPIREEDREKTAFFSGKRLLQFARMLQGYKNSPAIFQRMMTLIMGELIETSCVVYIDDILRFGRTKEEHDNNLKKVLGRLEV